MDEMEEAGVDMPTVNTLFRRYLSKITPEFRSLVLSKGFPLDGEGQPARKPKTCPLGNPIPRYTPRWGLMAKSSVV